MGITSLGMTLVAGRKRVPFPAIGMTALRIFLEFEFEFAIDMVSLN